MASNVEVVTSPLTLAGTGPQSPLGGMGGLGDGERKDRRRRRKQFVPELTLKQSQELSDRTPVGLTRKQSQELAKLELEFRVRSGSEANLKTLAVAAQTTDHGTTWRSLDPSPPTGESNRSLSRSPLSKKRLSRSPSMSGRLESRADDASHVVLSPSPTGHHLLLM